MIIPTVVQGLEVHGSSDLSFKIEHGLTRRNMTLYKTHQNTDMVKYYSFTFMHDFFFWRKGEGAFFVHYKHLSLKKKYVNVYTINNLLYMLISIVYPIKTNFITSK